MRNLLLNWWETLASRATLYLTIILLISLGLHVSITLTSEIPLTESRRQKIASYIVEHGKFAFCNSYFPFCGPDNDATASAGPIPVLVFVAFRWIFDDLSIYPIVILQILLNLATILILYKIVLHLFNNEKSALWGAFLWGTYIPIIGFGLYLGAETIFTYLLACGILALLYGLSNDRPCFWVLAGACFGLATLSRVSFLYFTPILTCLMGLIPSTWTRRRLTNFSWLIFAFILILTPWIMRNFLVFKAFVPGGTLNGYNLYRHNHIIADDNYLRYVDVREMRAATVRLIEKQTDIRGDENEFEMDRIYRQEAIQIIKRYPHRYLFLSLYRFLPLWTNVGFIETWPVLWQLIGAENIILVGLAIATVRRQNRLQRAIMLPILILIVYYTLGHMMVNAKIRFIVPIMPYVIALAADQCVYWITNLISKSRSLSTAT